MAAVKDPQTGLTIGDPERDPLGGEVPVSQDAVAEARSQMIVSASGWRKVFAADGNEDSASADVAPAERELAALAGAAFCEFLDRTLEPHRRTVVLGIDARPTGGLMAEILLRVLLSFGFEVEYLFITPIPEIIAYARSVPHAGAFLYLSASHNPLGHNGLKFGLAGEGVLPGSRARDVAAAFDRLCADETGRWEILARARAVSPAAVLRVLGAVSVYKPRAVSAYRAFSLEVADGSVGRGSAASAVAQGVSQYGCGLLIDFNGSARATSVDVDLLRGLGITVHTMNAAPRAVAHQILPEGPGLEPARAELARLAGDDRTVTLAYVPDNDGDRGNLVFAGAETALEAQEVFALAAVSELSWLSASGLSPSVEEPWAVVVNGPTSLRVERVAAAFGAEVHRCEVGEANVVETAQTLRQRGYLVRILGEGSNGGNILHPSRVRDPIATVFAFLKLLYARRGEDDLFGEWCRRSARPEAYRADYTLETVRATLPPFTTTGTGAPGAKLRVESRDHAVLKLRYREVFLREWDSRRTDLKSRYGFVRAEEIRYEGTESYVALEIPSPSGGESHAPTGGPKPAAHHTAGGTGASGPIAEPADTGNATGSGGPGGLKMQFYDAENRAIGFLWMRGSGTEPVFRAVVDIEGDDPSAEEELLDWHRAMIEEADRQAASG